MKKIIWIPLLLFALHCYSQEEKKQRLFYSFTLNGTLARNTNFGEYDYYTGEEDRNIFAIGAFFLRNGIEFKWNKLLTTGFKFGLDYHSKSEVLALPYYTDTKITISEVDDDKFYLSGGLGKLLKIADSFEHGTYFKVGIGYHIATEKSQILILNLDFHQKGLTDFERGKLNSLSLGFGVLF